MMKIFQKNADNAKHKIYFETVKMSAKKCAFRKPFITKINWNFCEQFFEIVATT